jgi:transglutaminase-like putative cysteine protease
LKKLSLTLVLCLAVSVTAAGQQTNAAASRWTITASPSFTLPLTAGDFSANALFSSAWGGSIGAEYSLATGIPLSLRVDAGYSIGGILPAGGLAVTGSLSEASLLAGAVAGFPLAPPLSLRGFAEGGAAYGSLTTGTSAVYGVARVGAGLDLKMSEDFIARLETAWTYKLGLYSAFDASLGMGWMLPAPKAPYQPPARPRLLEISSLDIKSVFPVLRSFYDEHPLGTARIVNTGKEPARNIKVSFIIRQYMDAPKECAVIDVLEPGQAADVKLFGLFNDKILSVTEATKASAEVSTEYANDGAQGKSATVTVYDRTALTWADDRMAAAFVSSKDPWVMDLCGNVVAAVKSSRNAELARNMQTAIAFHEGLRAYGLGYVLSPNRPFAQAVVDPEVVDSLKFPRQTLSYRSGDCADLSVLYASCFEAVGIETAFITVPGHIFMAVDLGLKPADLEARAMDARELIVKGDRVWLPIETTMREAGFLEVWKKAASEWRDASAHGVAAFYPVHEAWKLFAPVGLPADGSAVATPSQDTLVRGFTAELAREVDAELGTRVAALYATQPKGVVSPKGQNDLGVLYGRYGKLIDAEKQFKIAAKQGYLPSIVNLGNIAYLKDDMAGALGFYQQAAKASPDNAKILVSVARAAAALGKTDVVQSAMAVVRKLDPAAADQYSGLSATSDAAHTRAASQDEGGPIWF